MTPFRKWLKKKTCNPMQSLKNSVLNLYGDGMIYKALCNVERAIVGKSVIGIYKVSHFGANGGVLFESYAYNAALVNEGENSILDLYYRGQNAPAGFEVGLFNDTVAETDTPTDLLGEPSGNGYSRPALARNTTDFPTLALDSGDWKVTSKTVSFTASGGSIGPVNTACLITTDVTKRLVSFAELSQSRTLADGERLDVTFSQKLQ